MQIKALAKAIGAMFGSTGVAGLLIVFFLKFGFIAIVILSVFLIVMVVYNLYGVFKE